jgi:hypothetical protein
LWERRNASSSGLEGTGKFLFLAEGRNPTPWDKTKETRPAPFRLTLIRCDE